MKKKLMALLLMLSVLLIVSVITSCSCGNEEVPPESVPSTPGSTDTSTPGSGNPDNPDNPDNPGNGEEQENVTGVALPVLQYVRIASIGADNVTVKFNARGKNLTYDIRYSKDPITEENFKDATVAENVDVISQGEVKTVVLDLKADKENKYYIAVKVKSNGAACPIQTVRAGGVELVYVDTERITSIYCGEVIKDLTPLIDEFASLGDPLRGTVQMLPSNRLSKFYYHKDDWNEGRGDYYGETHERYGTDLAPIIDLEYTHYIDCIMVFYGNDVYDLDVRSSKDFANFNTPSDWDATNVSYPKSELKMNSWNKIEIGKEVRFIQLQFLDGEAPVEVIFYGYQTGETVGDEITNTQHKLPTVGDMMGMCALLGDGAMNTYEELDCVTVIREYHNLGWSYNWSAFPMKSTIFKSTNVGNFDQKYRDYSPHNLIIPCVQWSTGDNPARTYDKLTGKLNANIATFTEKYLPETYVAYADVMYQYAARYGSSKMAYLYDNVRAHSDGGDEIGLNYIKWLEFGNEPNGEDQRGATPYQHAAMVSAAYDGHMRTVLADVYNPHDYTYFLGAKNADPDIKVAMSGLAGIGNTYITSMCYWMRANREDIHGTWTSKNDTIAMDAFNVHTYFGEFYNLNGEDVCVGVSPEEYGLAEAMSRLIEFRNRYYPDVEVWLTEFGWDTNESYETMTSSHRYGEYTSRQVQAMWLTRAYLILSACGVDKATMYMANDLGNDRQTSGKYGTCGVFGYTFLTADEDSERVYIAPNGEDCFKDEEGIFRYADGVKVDRQDWVEHKLTPKAAFYYMSTLYKTLMDYTFRRELSSGHKDVWVYQYSNDAHDEAYALWCPTSNMTKVDGYKLFVGTEVNSVTLVETQVAYDEAGNTVKEGSSITGKSTTLTVDSEGYVSVNVTENPVYVVVDKK